MEEYKDEFLLDDEEEVTGAPEGDEGDTDDESDDEVDTPDEEEM